MSTNDDDRTFGLQLPLPLLETAPTGPVAVPDPAPEDGARPEPSWRLDEHTRAVGRRGVAEARARLRSHAPRAA